MRVKFPPAELVEGKCPAQVVNFLIDQFDKVKVIKYRGGPRQVFEDRSSRCGRHVTCD